MHEIKNSIENRITISGNFTFVRFTQQGVELLSTGPSPSTGTHGNTGERNGGRFRPSCSGRGPYLHLRGIAHPAYTAYDAYPYPCAVSEPDAESKSDAKPEPAKHGEFSVQVQQQLFSAGWTAVKSGNCEWHRDEYLEQLGERNAEQFRERNAEQLREQYELAKIKRNECRKLIQLQLEQKRESRRFLCLRQHDSGTVCGGCGWDGRKQSGVCIQ